MNANDKLKYLLHQLKHIKSNAPFETSFEIGDVKRQEFVPLARLVPYAKFVPHSYIQNWGLFLRAIMAGVDNDSLTDLSGASQTIAGRHVTTTAGRQILALNAGVGDTNYGILFGSGTQPVAKTDRQLQTLIAHGSNPTQLTYGATTIETESGGGNITQFRIIRSATNNTASTIQVKECGMGARSTNYIGATYYFLVERTVLPAPYDILAAATAYGRYTVRITT